MFEPRTAHKKTPWWQGVFVFAGVDADGRGQRFGQQRALGLDRERFLLVLRVALNVGEGTAVEVLTGCTQRYSPQRRRSPR